MLSCNEVLNSSFHFKGLPKAWQEESTKTTNLGKHLKLFFFFSAFSKNLAALRVGFCTFGYLYFKIQPGFIDLNLLAKFLFFSRGSLREKVGYFLM